jgi:hypothetical protein
MLPTWKMRNISGNKLRRGKKENSSSKEKPLPARPRRTREGGLKQQVPEVREGSPEEEPELVLDGYPVFPTQGPVQVERGRHLPLQDVSRRPQLHEDQSVGLRGGQE